MEGEAWDWEGSLVRISDKLIHPLQVFPLAALGCTPQDALEQANALDTKFWEEGDVAGKAGIALGLRVFPGDEGHEGEIRTLLVLTFENLLAYVPDAEVKKYAPNEGEFDYFWPALEEAPEPGGSFASDVLDSLASQGYCVVQMFMSPRERTQAEDAAQGLREILSFKKVLKEDYLGLNNTTDMRRVPPDRPEATDTTALGRFNRELTHLGCALAPLTGSELNFEAWGSWRTVARMPRKKGQQNEEAEMLDDGDAEDGLIGQHLTFLRSRKICLLYIISSGEEGGTLLLHPKESASSGTHQIPLRQGQVILFRHSHMNYEYKPSGGHSLALQSWMMAVPEGPEIDKIEATAMQKDYIYDIRGPQMLEGKMAQVMAMAIQISANVCNKETDWNLYSYGTDGQIQWPTSRFDEDLYYDANWTGMSNHSSGHHGSFLSDELYFGFNNTLFNISDEEARCMDVPQHWVCEVGYEAFCNAGFSSASLKGKRFGVFVGDLGADWNNLLISHAMSTYDTNFTATSCHNSIVPARLGYMFGFGGACASFDTACSSSLVATHHAHMMMVENDAAGIPCHGAICGGVNVLGPIGYINCSHGRFTTVVGRCFTFNRSGDGYARGEGCAFLYTRLSGDPEDIEQRLAALPGSASNHDGKSASLTAPNGRSQQQVMKLSMKMAGITPEYVTAVECHGTGTALGDPIEVGAVCAVMEGERDDPLPLTSSKSNIGHLEAGAGIMGLTKSLCILHAMATPPNLHLNILNAHLESDGFPQQFTTELTDLQANSGFCGVSSFGFGGANSRGDLYMKALEGPRKKITPLQSRIDYIATICPKCLGRMCWRCGQAVLSTASHAKHYCSLIRDPLANYEYCTNCYEGGYRWGEPLRIAKPINSSAINVYITGTWDGWSKLLMMDNVDREDPETAYYVCAVTLGDTLCEEFNFVLNGETYQTFYPSEKKAGMSAAVCGPDDSGQGRRWLINGRHDGASAGAVYTITLEWGDKLSVNWEITGSEEAMAHTSSAYEHTYELITSFLDDGGAWEGRKQMAPVVGEKGAYETTFPMSAYKKLRFNFIRDRDPEQVIYPAIPDTADEWVPVKGPPENASENKWLLFGTPSDVVKFKLLIRRGQISLTVSSKSMRATRWESAAEDNHLYFIKGTFTQWEPMPMVPDEYDKRVHRFRMAMDTSEYYSHSPGFIYHGREEFQISVNGEFSQTLYPEFPLAQRDEAVVQGPDGNGWGKTWLIVERMFTTLDIILDFAQEDRRKVVSWIVVPASMLDGVPRAIRSKLLTMEECVEYHAMLKARLLEEDVQKALDEAERKANSPENKGTVHYSELLRKLLLKMVWPAITRHFGFSDTYEGAWCIFKSTSARCNKELLELGIEATRLQRNWESMRGMKMCMLDNLTNQGPPHFRNAHHSWANHPDASVFYQPVGDLEERRCDPEDGCLYSWPELCKKYIGKLSVEETVEYWKRTCTRTAVSLPDNLAGHLPQTQDTQKEQSIKVTTVTEYRVLQRSCIRKLGSDPAGQAMVSVRRPVGGTVFTTGREWTGRNGAQWVELDKVVEKPGWLLVEGRGFGPPGPLLAPIRPGEPIPLVLRALVPTTTANTVGHQKQEEEDDQEEGEEEKRKKLVEYRKFVVNPDAIVRDAHEWIALIFGFEPSLIIIGAPGSKLQPFGGDTFNAKLLQDQKMGLVQAGFKDGDIVPYCYIGDATKAFEGKVPTWDGKLGAKRRQEKAQASRAEQPRPKSDKARPAKTASPSQLHEHFQTLGLDEKADPDAVKRQYRLLALACHPDKHPDDIVSATARFQMMKDAYEAIRDALDF